MAEAVVVLLEAVEVEEREDARVRLVGARQLGLEVVDQCAAVAQAGEGVGEGLAAAGVQQPLVLPVQAGGDGARLGGPPEVDDERQQQQQDHPGRADAGLVLRAHRAALIVTAGGVEHPLDRACAGACRGGQAVGLLAVAARADAHGIDLVQRGEVGAQRRLHRTAVPPAARTARAARRAGRRSGPCRSASAGSPAPASPRCGRWRGTGRSAAG